ncbi:hypothetical protein ACHWQZ_G013320 [Mnemiopsis leidyi]
MPCLGNLVDEEFEGRWEVDSDASDMKFELCESPTNFEYCHNDSKNLIEKIRSKVRNGTKFYSLEFFPPRTKDGAANLVSRMDRMNKGMPLFMDVTWHAGKSSASSSTCSSMTIASTAVNFCGIEILLHVTSDGLTRSDLKEILDDAYSHGIRNILALSGDNNSENSDFRYASEFVAWIKAEFDDNFVIAVAGYPEGHPESTYEDSLVHLKQKVDAGADFVITQLMFDCDKYERFIDDCMKCNINVPILAGVLPIQNYDSLRKLKKLACNVEVPKELIEMIEQKKDDDEAIREIGVKFTVELVKQLFEKNLTAGVHIYTLNREIGPNKIVKELGLFSKDKSRRFFPWQTTANSGRLVSEDVRPVYWAQRPKSYMTRTKTWDEFPNGRWGNSSNPAFGDLDDYHLFYMSKAINPTKYLEMWGYELKSIDDIRDVFVSFLEGSPNKQGYRVTSLPWADEQNLQPETFVIRDEILKLNHNYLFTINSQPSVNCAKSNDQTFGWGPKNGYIYQKAYIEFFARSKDARIIIDKLSKYPLLSYTLSNKAGTDCYTNYKKNSPIALTWGVFPGREIIQPTIADYKTFLIWKDEAFALWMEKWGKLYEGSGESKKVLEDIVDDLYLICLVDNDFVEGTGLWQFLDEVIKDLDNIGENAKENGS